MEMGKEKIIEMLAYEAFIRRASELDLPFMLKGSYVTRQYFQNPADRLPNDLDWVYLHLLTDPAEVSGKFGEWMAGVTGLFENDGVRFSRFNENPFWRLIDYAMADDFPTTNTDIRCWVDGELVDPIRIDISFNLDVEVPPVPLLYHPLRGSAFTIPNTVPLSLQVSWKLHQTLVRPRFKDLFDLIHLLQHPAFTPEVLQQTLQALVNECSTDNTDPNRLRYLLSDKLGRLFSFDIGQSWNYWRFRAEKGIGSAANYLYDQTATSMTDADKLPADLGVFTEQLRQALQHAGFDRHNVGNLPSPTRSKQK